MHRLQTITTHVCSSSTENDNENEMDQTRSSEESLTIRDNRTGKEITGWYLIFTIIVFFFVFCRFVFFVNAFFQF